MKKLHLLCNAHLDPYWLWEWEEGAAEALVRLLTGANQAQVVSYCTEGGIFQEAGLSTVVCGPGSIDQAHRPDEFIEIAQLEACEDFVRRLIAWAEEG